MGGLLSELGKKLAERWLTLLVLPGVLYLAVAVAAHTLGQAHALDVGRLTDHITAWAGAPAAKTIGGQVVLLAAVLAGAAAVGLAAQAIGSLTEQIVLAANWRTWPRPVRTLTARRVDRRATRWADAHAAYHHHRESAAVARTRGERADPAPRHEARRTRDRIAVEPSDRPTWSGDRIHAVALRLDRDLLLDFAVVWPHLWLHLPETVRTEITAARTAVTRATTLGGWTLLYAPLTLLWWPAAPLTGVLALISRHRIRTAVDIYAQLLEAVTRLHAVDLARHLGIDHTGPLTPGVGTTLTALLRTQPPPPAAPSPTR
ncbi:hypothetical protein [Streptomyces sp. NPDC002133]|uniref:hypothetical protein n=1 Tax=Streptomyces sp. NPDC002133 TaxID=3154409 RepID=UPI00331A9591